MSDRLQQAVRWGGWLAVLGVFAALGGCGDLVAEGSDESGSLFNVQAVTATYNGDNTRDVDIVQVICDPTATPPEVEYFSDHTAEVSFTNRPLPNATEQTASTIYLESYEIAYTPANDNARILPPLGPSLVNVLSNTVEIPPCAPGGESCAAVTVSGLDYVTLQTKERLRSLIVAQGWDPSQTQYQVKYNIQYTFFGYNDFGKRVSATGSDSFNALNYDYCEG